MVLAESDTMHADGTNSIRVNGEHRRVRDGTTLAELAAELGFVPEKVLIERNAELLSTAALAEMLVEDGDDLEITTRA